MNIIESTNIDLIEPFPAKEAKRVFNWLKCYKNIIESDQSPHSEEEFEEYLHAILPNVRSFGVVDKFNTLQSTRVETPLVGMIVFEPSTVWNYYIHIASPRRAWASGFMDEGINTALQALFASQPELLRVSAFVLENNGPVKGLARRLGWQFEALLKDMVTQNSQPKNVLHFGMTRRDFDARQAPTAALPPAEESTLGAA